MTTATEIAATVQSGQARAADIVAACLDRIERLNPALKAFTNVVAGRAHAKAAALDAAIAAGSRPGPLAGVPFAVKNLIDIAGLPTLAGSKINRDDPPATDDAPLVTRLEAAGAILVGALNMGEYAYDFTGENVHYGPSRNPFDTARMSGGSSGGSGSAVGGGLVPLALGSDTNGSIRVPSSFCGLFGLKPTYGRLTRTGTFPFVSSLDHLGPMARSTADLATAYDAMQGYDAGDPVCVDRPAEPVSETLNGGAAGLRIASADGYFRAGASPEALAALELVAAALGTSETITIAQASLARSAAYVITTTEGAALHTQRLRNRPDDFDADVRDRLIAGALVPAAAVVQAQKFRRWFRDEVLGLFQRVDAILAPATPCVAPLIGQKTFVLDGQEVPLRPNIGIYTQPISFIGLPVATVPVPTALGLPIGVQIITAPWREDLALRIARTLEAAGVVRTPSPALAV
ncbi:MAG TPA: AtzE family amidohydrolase [Rhodopila sp.]|jgi:aspartyl-tRNA(Asn)/glutamyl-tRNA(Gln) amidotransferase subunit A